MMTMMEVDASPQESASIGCGDKKKCAVSMIQCLQKNEEEKMEEGGNEEMTGKSSKRQRDGGGEDGVGAMRVVHLRMRRQDLEALLLLDGKQTEGGEGASKIDFTTTGNTVLNGVPAVEPVSLVVKRVRVQRVPKPEHDLPETFHSTTRPNKNQTATLWSKRQFLKQLYAARTRNNKKKGKK